MERFGEAMGELKRCVACIEQRGKESLSLLKISEGLVKRDISLVRKQIDVIVRKLEEKALSELKELFANEQENIQEVLDNIKHCLERAELYPDDEEILKDTEELLEEKTKLVTRKRFVYESNRQVIVALEQLQTLGDIKVKELTECGNEPTSPYGLSSPGKPVAKAFVDTKEKKLATHRSTAIKGMQDCKILPNGLDVSNNVDPFAVLRAMKAVDSSNEKMKDGSM